MRSPLSVRGPGSQVLRALTVSAVLQLSRQAVIAADHDLILAHRSLRESPKDKYRLAGVAVSRAFGCAGGRAAQKRGVCFQPPDSNRFVLAASGAEIGGREGARGGDVATGVQSQNRLTDDGWERSAAHVLTCARCARQTEDAEFIESEQQKVLEEAERKVSALKGMPVTLPSVVDAAVLRCPCCVQLTAVESGVVISDDAESVLLQVRCRLLRRRLQIGCMC